MGGRLSNVVETTCVSNNYTINAFCIIRKDWNLLLSTAISIIRTTFVEITAFCRVLFCDMYL